ncbi:MAG: recombinase family protein [Rhizomicrobium sp.]|nr:recombinase family protein [Rhizomicrobium sp.]
MKQYFGYIRVSTAKQGDHGSSLQEQRSAIEAYAANNGLLIGEWFEERETAAKQGRAIFSRMLAKLEKGEAQGVVIHKIDRSARNLKDWANLGDLIDRGIDVKFVHDSFDMRSRGGRLSADIQAVVAADYIRNLRDEVRKGFYGRLKQGFYPLPAPIGYVDMGGGKVKEIDPVRGPLVREAFELYASGTMCLRTLQAEMKRRGLLTKSGKPLPLNSLHQMLRSSFYIGQIHIAITGEVFEGNHEPLVSKATFDRVQAIMHGKLVRRVVKHDFIFRRLVRCGRCGRHLVGELQKGRYIYYRCQVPGCRGTIAREKDLDNAVQSALVLLRLEPSEQKWIDEHAATLRKHDADDLERLKVSLQLRLAKTEDRLSRLTDAYLDHDIDKEVFEHRKGLVLNERAGLRDELGRLSDADLPVHKAIKNLELGKVALSGYQLGIPVEKRAIIESITSNFTLHGKYPEIALHSPFREWANWRKSQFGAPRRDTPRERAAQILNIAIGLAKEEINAAVAQKKVA